MLLSEAFDVVEHIIESQRNGEDPIESLEGFYRFGFHGFRITKASTRKVLKAIESSEMRNWSLEEIRKWIADKIREGYKKVYFYKRGWKAKY